MDHTRKPQAACRASVGTEAVARAQDAALNTVSRRGDNFLDIDGHQLGRMTGLMRRLEDLSDRIVGVVPIGEDAMGSPPQGEGFIGALDHLHVHRDLVLSRIEASLERIERVL